MHERDALIALVIPHAIVAGSRRLPIFENLPSFRAVIHGLDHLR